MMKQVQRKYGMYDAGLIGLGRLNAGNLANNLADFTAVDKSITPDFVDRLNLLTTQAEETVTDEVVSDRQVQLTLSLNDKMKECKDHFKLMSYFAKKAFPNNVAIRNEFGENDYSETKYSQPRMIVFMKTLSGVVLKYKQDLLTAGASEEQIAKTLSLHDELVQANHEQELYMSNRPVLTSDRITGLNEIYDNLKQISELAKIIYADDYAKLKLFLIPTRSKTATDESVVIEAHTSLKAIEDVIAPDTFIKIENTGTVKLTFYVAETMIEETGDFALILDPGKEEIIKSDDISNETFGMLIAVNNTDAAGKFKTLMLT